MKTVIPKERITMKQKMSDILLDVSWAKISQRYFEKSPSWLYHKLDGVNNGKEDDFNEEEKEQLKGALYDLAERIRYSANKI